MRETVQQIIYDEVITAVLKIVNRLNLSSKTPFTADEVICVCICMILFMCVFCAPCIPVHIFYGCIAMIFYVHVHV